MNKFIKKAAVLVFAAVFVLSFAGCSAIYKLTAPEEYRQSVSDAEQYPEDAIPLPENTVVYEYKESADEISLAFGSTEDFDDISDFYGDFFYDNDIYLSSEKDRSKAYLASGEYGAYEFQIAVELPSGKWEERLFKSVAEIELKRVNIPNKSELYSYLDELTNDLDALRDIFETNTAMDNSDEEDMGYFVDGISDILESLASISDRIKEYDIPDTEEFASIHSAETELINLLLDTFTDYREVIVYTDDFLSVAGDMLEFDSDSYQYYYDEFSDVAVIFDDFARSLEQIPTPSSLQDFTASLIDALDETVQTSLFCIDAIDYGDNVRFYAGLYSYETNYRNLSAVFSTFDSDINLIGDRLDGDIAELSDTTEGIAVWLDEVKSDIEEDSEELTAVPDELKLYEQEQEVFYQYTYPLYIIPANYRSLDYIAFLEIFTDKGKADVKITVEIPGFTEKYERKIEVSRGETEVKIHPPLLTGAIDSLNTSKDARLVISIENLDTGEYVVQESQDIDIYSRYDMQWYDEEDNSYVENILAWMTPEAPEISSLLRASADSVYEITEGAMDSMIGYQSFSDWEDYLITYYQTAAVMHALSSAMDVTYIMEPFSSTDHSLQRVKTPAQVINTKGGLCAETALTVASALQAMNMHPVIILLPGHMQTAVETWYGSGEYYLIETTALSDAASGEFGNVIYYLTPEEWDEYLSRDGYTAIDCDLADQYGIKSIY